MKETQLVVKRLFDIVVSFMGILLLLPVFCIIAVLIKTDSKGPIFFLQERIGKNEKKFKIFKLRTMIDNAVNIGSGIYIREGDPRITRIGNFLRRTSIDELPQLINILIGDMSLIGPRPAIDLHLKQYNLNDYKRFRMRPGMTGLAQINGRSSIPLTRRLMFDQEYVCRFSLWLDFKIFIKSIFVVLRGKGLYHSKLI